MHLSPSFDLPFSLSRSIKKQNTKRKGIHRGTYCENSTSSGGTVFQGESTGAAGLTVGEVVFNTSMTGYQEILTDPSYTGQLVTLTCAHIGNVGVNPEDMESNAIHAAGLIVKAAADVPSNWRARQSLPEALKDAGVKAICGIDTRALTIHLRGRRAHR